MKNDKSIDISGIRFYLVWKKIFVFKTTFPTTFCLDISSIIAKFSVNFSVLSIDSRQKLVCPSSLKAYHVSFKSSFESASLPKTCFTIYVSKIFQIVILKTSKSKMTKNFAVLTYEFMSYLFIWTILQFRGSIFWKRKCLVNAFWM